MLCFNVGSKEAFEVSLADVSQSQIQGKTDVVLEFHVDDTTGANEKDSLMDLSFHVPTSNTQFIGDEHRTLIHPWLLRIKQREITREEIKFGRVRARRRTLTPSSSFSILNHNTSPAVAAVRFKPGSVTIAGPIGQRYKNRMRILLAKT